MTSVDVLGAVQKAIERGRLLPRGATVVVGVSGGADSLCLLHVLRRLRADYGWSLHVAHLDHCLRGDDSHEDMSFVALLALEWGLPCLLEAADVGALARRRRLSLEEAARQARYGFLSEAARRVGAGVVAVGHNADDQSETVLMHFVRGAGLAGLRGMPPATDLASLGVHTASANVQLVRPLLTVPRAEIERYCQEQGLVPRLDRSNWDTSFFRNRLRHELLPLLESYNPNARAVLRRTAETAAADYEVLAGLRDEAWEQLASERRGEVLFELAAWRALPLALRRATLRQAVQRLRSSLRDVGFVHIEQAVEIASNGSTGAQAVLPQGLHLTVGYSTLCLSSTPFDPACPGQKRVHAPDWPLLWRDESLPVALPGQTVLPDSSWQVQAQFWEGERDTVQDNPDRWTAYVDADCLRPGLALRSRRPGDRFQPLGLGGRSVKLADFMINVKIPRCWRARIPLLVHSPPGAGGEDQIAWVVGWRVDERVRVSAKTQRVMRLGLCQS
jgi:tRNA(Ile)-lysidine synthase